MQWKRTRAALGAAAVLAVTLAACSDAPTGAAPSPDPEQSLVAQIAAMGFRADLAEDRGDHYLVEGDIQLSKAYLRTLASAGTPSAIPGPSFQYRTTNQITAPGMIHNIKVDLSRLASHPAWLAAAREALTHWNNVPGSYVRLTEGTPANIDVLLGSDVNNSRAGGGQWPENGEPGDTITLYSSFYVMPGWNAPSHSVLVRNAVHEFGHALGFAHSNVEQLGEQNHPGGGVHIVGTPTSGNDPASVMNGGTPYESWIGFSVNDRIATAKLYPLPMVSATVTNSGGYPLITWGALQDASSYSVRMIQYTKVVSSDPWTHEEITELGSTTGTSLLDSVHPYTGTGFCLRRWSDGTSRTDKWEYEIITSFPNGASYTRVGAPVGRCLR